jgi:hypothetical protein
MALVSPVDKEHHVFGRLRLVGRRAHGTALNQPVNSPGVFRASVAGLHEKGQMAYALSHAPAWTNHLGAAGMRGHAANARLAAGAPSAAHDVRLGPPPAPHSEPSVERGGSMWHPSAGPR